MGKGEQKGRGYEPRSCFYWSLPYKAALGFGAMRVDGGETMKIVGLQSALDNLG